VTIIRDLGEWRRIRTELGSGSIGLVPTMGALHEGHLSLIRRAAAENDACVTSVFVNAPQFNDPADLQSYPRRLDGDGRLAAAAGADIVLAPEHAAIYADDYRYRVTENHLSRVLEGAQREGHFDGVLTVVLKLLNIVAPDRAYFGDKDFQQYLLVRGMVEALFVPVEIVACPTVRDPDGLALSSRNARLSPEGRLRAARLPELLAAPEAPERVRQLLEEAGFEVDYLTDIDHRRLAAVRIEGVRLIDNLVLE
jgi:pantoate--beta-alanine ligase